MKAFTLSTATPRILPALLSTTGVSAASALPKVSRNQQGGTRRPRRTHEESSSIDVARKTNQTEIAYHYGFLPSGQLHHTRLSRRTPILRKSADVWSNARGIIHRAIACDRIGSEPVFKTWAGAWAAGEAVALADGPAPSEPDRTPRRLPPKANRVNDQPLRVARTDHVTDTRAPMMKLRQDSPSTRVLSELRCFDGQGNTMFCNGLLLWGKAILPKAAD